VGDGLVSALSSRRVAGRLTAALLCASVAVLSMAGAASAASVTFGTGSAVSTFGKSIVFTQPYSGGPIASANILVQTPDDVGPSVTALPSVGAGSLVASLDMSTGTLFPNTPVTAHFEAILGDGTTVEGPAIHVTYVDDRFSWKTVTGKIVRLHYIDATGSFAQSMLNLADGGVAKAATLFGVSETQPIDYFVYPSQSVFQQGLNQPDTIGGVAMPSFRTAFAVVASGDSAYAAQVMPHEPTHIVFADATANPYHDPPRWLNEGFAQYVAQGYDSNSRQLVSQAVGNGTLVSLLALTDFFPLDSQRIYLAYAESVSAVDFMVRTYGQAAIAKLTRAYAGGGTDDEAFTAAFGVTVASFDAAWLAANGAKPTKYGPQPAPTGPLPPDWNSSSSQITPGPTEAGGPVQTGSTSGQPGQSTGQSSNQAGIVLAGLLALAGLVSLGASATLVLNSRRKPAR
jgi:Peptidase MA superfamily